MKRLAPPGSRRKITRRSKWRDFRGTLRPAGAVLAGFAVAEAVCALIGGAVEWWTLPPEDREPMDVLVMLIVAGATVLFGFGMFTIGKIYTKHETLTRREALLAVTLIWVLTGIGGAIPFVMSAGMRFDAALFETVSGMTTTGATAIPDIEGTLSMPLLLWRSVIQWLGGMGIVVLFVAVFPSMGAGAKHMFKGEVPGTTAEGLRPRIAETSMVLWRLYVGLTLVEAVLLMALGMSPFEAACHSFTTMATGGFSTRNASVAAFDSYAIDMVISTFMLLGSLNYGLFYALMRGTSWRLVLRNTELRVFFALVVVFTLVLTIGIRDLHGGDLTQSFRYAYFMVASTISSTGFTTDNFSLYSQPIMMVIVIMMFIGGCSGSTAGGLKVERMVLLAKMSWVEFHESFRPSMIHVVRMGRAAVPRDILIDVGAFFAVFMGTLGFGVLFVSTTDGVSLDTAFGATLTCLSNIGPAPWYIEQDNFAHYSAAAKIFFVVAMLLGRLEFFTMFALLVPDFWRR